MNPAVDMTLAYLNKTMAAFYSNDVATYCISTNPVTGHINKTLTIPNPCFNQNVKNKVCKNSC
jgi:hypothetical protein